MLLKKNYVTLSLTPLLGQSQCGRIVWRDQKSHHQPPPNIGEYCPQQLRLWEEDHLCSAADNKDQQHTDLRHEEGKFISPNIKG